MYKREGVKFVRGGGEELALGMRKGIWLWSEGGRGGGNLGDFY